MTTTTMMRMMKTVLAVMRKRRRSRRRRRYVIHTYGISRVPPPIAEEGQEPLAREEEEEGTCAASVTYISPHSYAPSQKKRKADEDEPKKPAKKAKKKKDPNAPKGKSSAFIFFGSATRAEIKAAHPDWSLGDVGRELGKRWKELSEDDKKPYHDLAAKDAERYKTEMEAYKAKQAADEE